MVSLIGIYPSTSKHKKYVALFDLGNGKTKQINFGSKNSETYLDHKNITKRANYVARHTALGTEDYNDPLTPASLSMFLLWGKHTDLDMNIKEYKNMYNI